MKAGALCYILVSFAVAAHAQGTVDFKNINPGSGINAPVYESDGMTPLSGSQFMAELLGGASANNLATIATTGFLTGVGAGYYNGGEQQIPGVLPGGTAWVTVRVWNTGAGASFVQAQGSGLPNSWWQSSVFTVIPGGGSVNPTTPAPLTGLGNSPVYLNSFPEPSTLALLSSALALAVLKKGLTRQRTE